jgi:HAD superfamily hydrolase (TIGR01509 family)
MPLAALFDLDGTLINSNEAHVAAWVAVFTRKGYDVSAEAIRGQIGKGGDLLVPALLPGVAGDEVDRLSDAHGEVFKAQSLKAMRPFPGAHELVARARAAGLKAAIASSASQGELDHYLDLLGIRDLVDAGTVSDDVETTKPAPDIFSVALERLGVSPADAVAIGDSPFDVQSAGRAGVPTVALLSGGFPADALADAAAIYRDPADLLANWDGSPLAKR